MSYPDNEIKHIQGGMAVDWCHIQNKLWPKPMSKSFFLVVVFFPPVSVMLKCSCQLIWVNFCESCKIRVQFHSSACVVIQLSQHHLLNILYILVLWLLIFYILKFDSFINFGTKKDLEIQLFFFNVTQSSWSHLFNNWSFPHPCEKPSFCLLNALQ